MKADRRKIVLAGCAAAALLLAPIRSVLLPFLLSLFLAGCLQRPINALAQRHIPRWLSAIGILLLFLAPLFLMAGYGVITLFHSAQDLVRLLIPLLREKGDFDDWLYRILTALPPALQDAFSTFLDTLGQQKEQLMTRLLSQLGLWSSQWISSLPSHITEIGLFLLFFLFSAIGYPELKELTRGVLPADWQRAAARIQRAVTERFSQWCRAECKLVGLIFGELALGLALLRFKSWLFFALAIALIDMVPMVGSGLILLPWAALRLLLGSRVQALGLALLWVCVWGTRTILEPKLVGKHLQLPTTISFFAAILGLKLWGIKGLILFPVLSAVAVGLLRRDREESAAPARQYRAVPRKYR